MEELCYVIPDDKLYAVVELVEDVPTDDGETEIVKYATPASSNWLVDVVRQEDEEGQTKYFATCKWPRLEDKLTQFLEKRTKPGTDWVTFSHTRVLRFCRSIGQAKEQAEKALANDELSQSDGADLPRRRKTTMRFGYDREADTDSESEPPPMKSLKLNCTLRPGVRPKPSKVSTGNGAISPPKRRGGSTLNDYSDNEEVAGENIKQSSTAQTSIGEMPKATDPPKKDSCKRKILDGKESDSGSSTLPSTAPRETKNKASKSASPNKTPQSGRTGSSRPLDPSPFSTPSSSTTSLNTSTSNKSVHFATKKFSPRKVLTGSNPVTHYVFMREMQDLWRILNGMQISINKLYQCVCPVVESTQDNEGRGIPALPVDSFEAMVVWEDYLKDHDNSLNVVRLLSERCLNTCLKDSVYSMLKFLMSNRLASSYNYRGKNKKAALKSFKDYLKKKGSDLHYSTGPAEVGNAISLWLKDAPKRFLIDLKATRKVPASATNVPDDLFLSPPPESGDTESEHEEA